MDALALSTPGSRFSIEPASWRDLNSLRHLERVCFPQDAWPLLDLIGVLTLPSVVRLKSMADGLMVGFVAGDVRRPRGLAWIATIAVLPEFRRQGIGRALLGTCERRMQVATVRLNVRASNGAAEQMYLQSGYRRVELWPAYYQDGEDALVMEKTVP